MKYAILIDEDQKSAELAQGALSAIDPKMAILCFSDLGQFTAWLKTILSQDPNARSGWVQGTDEVVLLVVDIDRLSTRFVRLLKRATGFFIHKKVCKAENPTSFILTVHPHDKFNIQSCETQYVTNVLFKPYDLPIVKQIFNVALAGNQPVSNQELYVQKSTADVEMLKDVQMKELMEWGFSTLSDVEIPVHSISKYHSPLFNAGKRLGTYARCVSNQKHPTKSDHFISEFFFFGASPEQIIAVRKTLRAKGKQGLMHPFALPKSVQQSSGVNLVVLHPKSEIASDLSDLITRSFQNALVSSFTDFAVFLKFIDPPATPAGEVGPIDAILIDESFLISLEPKIKLIQDLLQKKQLPNSQTPFFVIDTDPKGDGPRRFLVKEIFDVFYFPFDRSAILQKLALFLPQLLSDEIKKKMEKAAHSLNFKVAKEVQVQSVSESGLTMKYNRPLPIGEFRYFFLPFRKDDPLHTEVKGLLARCQFQQNAEKEFSHGFTFFGVTDTDLKHIRRWILDTYVSKKSQD